MQYMIIEHFKNQDPLPVYRRFRDHGRLAPEGLRYISSWVDEKFETCFQLMETDDLGLLDQWLANGFAQKVCKLYFWSAIASLRTLRISVSLR